LRCARHRIYFGNSADVEPHTRWRPRSPNIRRKRGRPQWWRMTVLGGSSGCPSAVRLTPVLPGSAEDSRCWPFGKTRGSPSTVKPACYTLLRTTGDQFGRTSELMTSAGQSWKKTRNGRQQQTRSSPEAIWESLLRKQTGGLEWPAQRKRRKSARG